MNKLIHMKYKWNTTLQIPKTVRFYKSPKIITHKKAKIILGENVSINSDNQTYHLNMFQACKLMADIENAKIEIGDNSRIHGSCIHAQDFIFIGKNCLIAANCQIMDNNGHPVKVSTHADRIQKRGESKAVYIEDGVWLGTGVVVLPGVTIGEGSVIGANSVVSVDIPKFSIAIGNPIQIVKTLN